MNTKKITSTSKETKQSMSQQRAKDIQKIHIAQKELAMDDMTYRALLLRVTGKTSSKDLNDAERSALLKEFKRLGFKVKAKSSFGQRPQVSVDRTPRMRKIEALLAEAGRSWKYLDPIITNLKRSHIRFCDENDLSAIISALMKDAKRHGRV